LKDTSSHHLIRHALGIGALELLPKGRMLKSGRLSPYFFNSGGFTSGQSLRTLAAAYAEALEQSTLPVEIVFGPAYKGIPLVAAVAMEFSSRYKNDVGFCFNRKEVKKHGEGGLLVGAQLDGKIVAIVDDVITDGSTKEEAFEIVKQAGGTVTQIVLGFDRQERAAGKLSAAEEFSNKHAIPIFAAANLDTLLDVLRERGDTTMIELIEQYRQQYGA